MSVAGLHNVSVCDSAPDSIRWGDQDRPSSRTSSIMKMWRELEGEHVMSRPAIKVGKRHGKFTSQTSDSDDFGSLESLDGTSSFGTVTTDDNGNRSCLQSLSGSDNRHEDSNSFSSSQSSYLGESARKRVRKIFHEWKNSGVNSRSPTASHENNHPRPQWLGQSECERVRSVKEWVQKGGYGFANEVRQQGSKCEHIQDGRMINCPEVTRQGSIRKLCGREAIHDMLARFQSERKKEILCILELRAVSDFAHRNRIQSLLRGRFLMNRRLVQEERPASDALSELGLLTRINTVSTMREGFLSGGVYVNTRGIGHTKFLEARDVKYESYSLNTGTHDDNEVDRLLPFDLVECSTSEVTSYEGNDWETYLDPEISAWERVKEERNMWQETGSQWYDESDTGNITEQNHTLESVSLQEATAIHTWLDVEYGQEAGSAETSNSFYFPEEESIQTMELTQLQKRRRVSGLLRSGFRERLDQLIQSFVQRQNDTSTEWEGDESSSSHASLEEEQDPLHNLDNRVQPSWAQEMLPWEIIKELRTGMAILHERVNNMENMLETCMNMENMLETCMNKGGLLHQLRQDC